MPWILVYWLSPLLACLALLLLLFIEASKDNTETTALWPTALTESNKN